MKKILIVTFYWPPAGGSGVQRWLYMSKHLAEMGYKVYIYTPENAIFQAYDYSLLKDVSDKLIIIKKKIKDPWYYYNKLFGKKIEIGQGFAIKSSNKNSIFKKLILKISLFIRANFIIPDPRIFWVKPSVRFLKKYITDEKIDIVITTGPPHSMHLIGLKLKKKLKVNWIADFRDPMSQIYYMDFLKPSNISKKILYKYEKKIVQLSDLIVTVSKSIASYFFNEFKKHSIVIENGYENDFFKNINYLNNNNNENFIITHVGNIPLSRNPINLWKAIRILIDEKVEIREKIKIILIGKIDESVVDILNKMNLLNYIDFKGELSHEETINYLMQSNILFLMVNIANDNKGIITGKVFEYIASKKTILAIGPLDGDLSLLLKETKSGKILDYNDIEGIKNFILNTFYKLDDIKINNNILKYYSRKFLSYKFSKIIEQYF